MTTDHSSDTLFSPRRLPVGRLELPPPGAVHTWFVDLEALGNPLDLEARGQPDAEPAPLPVRQRRSLRRFYLRLILGGYLGIPGKDVHILRTPRGKPHLADTANPDRLQFSVTSSGQRSMVAVTREHAVGIDLEPEARRTADPLRLARRYLSQREADELALLSGAALDTAFIFTWACNEAVVKASGQGIANALCHFSVSTDPGAPPRVVATGPDMSPDWALTLVRPEPGYVGAVALAAPALEVIGYRLLPPAVQPGAEAGGDVSG